VERGVFGPADEAATALRSLTDQINKVGTFPSGTLGDMANAGRFLVPTGNNGACCLPAREQWNSEAEDRAHSEVNVANGSIELKVSDDDGEVGYVSLPDHPGSKPGVAKKSVQLRDFLPDYAGPDLVFDFDETGKLIGIEILG
jgi:Protein of unknown function (DUF2283)